MIRFLIFIVGMALSIHLAGADWSSYGADPVMAFSLPALLQASD